LEQIAQRLLEISRVEGLKTTPQMARDVARGSGCDVRQSINELQFMSRGDMFATAAKSDATGLTMDRAFNPFDAVTALFGCNPKDSVKLAQRVYESDAMLGPLLIQENYLKAAKLDLEGMSDVADAISEGDVMECAGRRGPVMLDAKALMTCAIPCALAGAKIDGRLDFPGFLGRGSTLSKNKRSVGEAAKRVLASRTRFATEIMPFLYKLAVEPLMAPKAARAEPPGCLVKDPKPKRGAAKGPTPAQGVAIRLTAMGLTRDDWDTVLDLGRIQNKSQGPIPAVVKAALTREMTKSGRGRAGSSDIVQKRKRGAPPSKPPEPKRQRLSTKKEETEEESEGEEEDEEGEEL
jgi:hypothetical protein